MQSTGGWNVATGNVEFVASILANALGLLSPDHLGKDPTLCWGEFRAQAGASTHSLLGPRITKQKNAPNCEVSVVPHI